MANDLRTMTKELVQGFVSFKLKKGSPTNNISLTARTLRRIASEVELKHGDLFANMIKAITCSSDDISESYSSTVESMFADNVINWGRIAVLIAFSGHLAVYCSSHNMPEESALVALWLTAFINRRLLQWIKNNGGWDSFNEHFKEKKGDSGMHWSDVLCTVGLVAGAAGAALVFAR